MSCNMQQRIKLKKIVYLSSMEQYGIQQIDYQNMTEEDLGYIDH